MTINFDGDNLEISLSTGTTTLDVVDLYSRWKDWVKISDNAKYLVAFARADAPGVPLGGDDIDLIAGTTVPVYLFLTNGWRIRPQEASHTLTVTSGILLVLGGGDPFLDTLGTFTVRINYQQPVQAITVATGGAGATAQEVWEYPVPVTPVAGSFGEFVARKLLTISKYLGLK